MKSISTSMRTGIGVFIISTLIALPILAQTQPISGKVTDSKGRTITGATVFVKGTSKGTLTDVYGKYSLPAGPSDALIISQMGFTTKEVIVGTKSTIDVTLLLIDDTQLKEIKTVPITADSTSEKDSSLAKIIENKKETNNH